MDLTREAFSAEKFDVALDKACLDSIMCSTQARADNYLQQMDRWAFSRSVSYVFFLARVAREPAQNMTSNIQVGISPT